MKNLLGFFLKRLKEKLWLRPLVFCLVSVALVFLAHWADTTDLGQQVPKLKQDSLKELLTTISASMLVIAIFAVGSMIAAYSAATTTATPRSFSLIIADDVSQNALSVYIGAFIYSVIATVALQNNYFERAGQFALLLITLTVFAVVILTFLRWVQRISSLGRLNTTVEKIEKAASDTIVTYLKEPTYGGVPLQSEKVAGIEITADEIGYVQMIHTHKLQKVAEKANAQIIIQRLPGAYVTDDKPLVKVVTDAGSLSKELTDQIKDAFTIGKNRVFDHDPRFALIALTEVASRALSPGINDPGTAIVIIGVQVRLFCLWSKTKKASNQPDVLYNRVIVPQLEIADLFDDAFRPIARDGANNIEVMIRLQKAFRSIAMAGDAETKLLAQQKAADAFDRAKESMDHPADVEKLKTYSWSNMNL